MRGTSNARPRVHFLAGERVGDRGHPLRNPDKQLTSWHIALTEAQDKASYRLTLALWKRPGEVRRKLMVGQPMSALGQKRTLRSKRCPLYPQKRTCAVH
jgi:hypothetical protein